MRRKGHTYRIHDFGRLTIAFDHSARGGCYNPEIHFIYRQPAPEPGRPNVIRYRRLNIRVPVLGWPRAYAWRRFGALRLYSLEMRIVYRLFR